MAKVILKDLKKVYPNTEKKKKAKKGEEPQEKKSNLQITDEGVVAVQDFNLHIADKEFIVLVGPSGCGKSLAPGKAAAPYGRSPHCRTASHSGYSSLSFAVRRHEVECRLTVGIR